MADYGYREFSGDEVNRGIAFAKNEHGIDIPFITLRMLANEIRKRMHVQKLPYESAATAVLDEQFRPRFREAHEDGKAAIHAEYEAHASTLGKMFNNRKNARSPALDPERRASGKQGRKPRVTLNGSQLGWKF